MGRLTHMHASSPIRNIVVGLGVSLFLAGCSDIGSAVSITDRPLSEQLDDRLADAEAPEAPVETAAAEGAPTAVAFTEASTTGDFLRLTVANAPPGTSLRSGPGNSYDELAVLGNGAEVLATGDRAGAWVYVIYGEFAGWLNDRRLSVDDVPADDVVVTASDIDASPVVYVVTGDTIGVNIRAEANAESELLSGASLESDVVGTGRTDGSSIEVTFNGVTGWAAGNYLVPAE
jgi:uncharacterized protein YraI